MKRPSAPAAPKLALAQAGPARPVCLLAQPKGGKVSPNQAPTEAPKKPRGTRASFISYHSRRCSICRHPERELIDQEFLHWTQVDSIAETYEIDRRAIYRHAHATNLFSQRNRGLRFALGHIIEQAQDVEVTADSIIRAVRLFACLNDDGEWVAPPPRSAPFQTIQRTAQRSVANPSGRSTHPSNLSISQAIENTARSHLQIDTNSHP